MASNVLTDRLSEPLDGATTAKVDIDSGTGHLTIGRLSDSEKLLADGTLQHLEKQGVPTRSVSSSNGEATLTLKAGGGGRTGFRFPWQACAGGAYEWQINLNPKVSSDITAHSDGGNIRLDLTGMAVTHVSADTGGGNMDVLLPDDAHDLSVAAKSGAGNVTVEIGGHIHGTGIVDANSGAGNVVVRMPRGIAARIHATSGLGKVIVDPQFSKIDKNSYESSGYESAANRVEITVKTGAGNVNVNTK